MHCRSFLRYLATASLATAVSVTSAPRLSAQPSAKAAVPARVASLPGANVISAVATDYAFEMPSRIPAGLTTIRFSNKGKEFHHLYLVKVEKGKKPDDVLAFFKAGGPPPKWMKPVGGPNAPAPGAETVFTSTLEAGDYIALCVIPSPGGPPHVMKGMIKPITVTASTRKAPAPIASITLTLSDYTFAFSKPLSSGKHVIAVRNSGTQPHEFFMAQLMPGKTPMDMAKFAENPVGAPPGKPMGGITDIVPGDVVYLQVDVPKGEYAFMCFTPDMKDGKPHLAHGMIQQISVK